MRRPAWPASKRSTSSVSRTAYRFSDRSPRRRGARRTSTSRTRTVTSSLSAAAHPSHHVRPGQFVQALRDRIRRSEITTTVRLWQRPHVKVGGRYALPPGEILVTKVFDVSLADITPELARQ